MEFLLVGSHLVEPGGEHERFDIGHDVPYRLWRCLEMPFDFDLRHILDPSGGRLNPSASSRNAGSSKAGFEAN